MSMDETMQEYRQNAAQEIQKRQQSEMEKSEEKARKGSMKDGLMGVASGAMSAHMLTRPSEQLMMEAEGMDQLAMQEQMELDMMMDM